MNVVESKSFNRRSLHEELIENMRLMIINGELEPGVKVPEKDLCELFNVSRTPMREALKVLAADGLVILEPNRGARVSRIGVEDLEEIFPVMGALEALAGELACEEINDSELAEIRALHDKMRAHYERGERPPYFELNQKIHNLIISAARNVTLSQVYSSLSGRVRRARYAANMTQDRWDSAMAEHEVIMSQLENRDGAALSATLHGHLRNKLDAVREMLRQDRENLEC